MSLASAATGSFVFGRTAGFKRAFTPSGTATPTKQRGIALEKQLAATGFPEQSNDTGIEVFATPTGVGSAGMSTLRGYPMVKAYAASAAVAIGKAIGKGISIVGRGVSTLTGAGIEPDSGRGVLRLIVRTVLRDKTRERD